MDQNFHFGAYNRYPPLPLDPGRYMHFIPPDTRPPNHFTSPPSHFTSPQPSTSGIAPSSSFETTSSESGCPVKSKKPTNTDRWNEEETVFVLDQWADNIGYIESKNARKAWEQIATNLNKRFIKTSPRTVAQVQRKLKYLKDKYKEVKDWNRLQSGGNRKTCPHYDKIDSVLGTRDVVTFQHVTESGAKDEGIDTEEPKAERTERKKGKGKGKRKRSEEKENDQDKFDETMEHLAAQSGKMMQAMEGVMKSMERSQNQQQDFMDRFLRAISPNQPPNKNARVAVNHDDDDDDQFEL